MKYVTREVMRELDRTAIEEIGIPGVVLMENAGRNVTEAVLAMLPDPAAATVFIFCGKGNNGGDGFVIARHLHNHGVRVRTFVTFAVEEASGHPGDAATNLRVALNMGLSVDEIADVDGIPDLSAADVIVDALLGTGLEGDVREPIRTLIERINGTEAPAVAVDIPSGLCCNTGVVLGAAVRAVKTITFACAKEGFRLAEGPEHVGELVVAVISIPRELIEKA